MTTTIRVDRETHRLLTALSTDDGTTLQQTVRAAAEALRRQRFGEQVARELTSLRTDPLAWADYLADGDGTSVADGVTG